MNAITYRDVVDALPAFVIALDEHGKVVFWNRQLERITGYQASEVLGTRGKKWLNQHAVHHLPVKHGGYRLVRWSVSQLPALVNAGLVCAIGIDITDESEQQQRTMRRERLAAVGTLAAGLAHEVRNPLNSAALQLQLMERKLSRGDLDPATLATVLRVVKSEIQRLDRLVTDFLEFARPTPTCLERTDLVALVEDALLLLRGELQQARVQVVRNFEAKIRPIPVDAKRMQQVLLNLIKNSLEAMNPDGGTLTLRIEALAERPAVSIDIEDTGPGFASDAPIFDAFFTTKDHGTGLGLAIVHRIVSEHDGTISCASEPGRTCFSIVLPSPADPLRP